MSSRRKIDMKINKPYLLFVIVSFSLIISGCDNAREMYAGNTKTKELIESKNVLDYEGKEQLTTIRNLPITQTKLDWSSIDINNEKQVDEIAFITEMHDAKLQSLGYSGDSELSLSISYYPKKFTMPEFENLEADLEALTGLKVIVFKKSVIIKPL